jgi:hypothetical protein
MDNSEEFFLVLEVLQLKYTVKGEISRFSSFYAVRLHAHTTIHTNPQASAPILAQ